VGVSEGATASKLRQPLAPSNYAVCIYLNVPCTLQVRLARSTASKSAAPVCCGDWRALQYSRATILNVSPNVPPSTPPNHHPRR
jgi:hypothetical protein